MRVLGAILAGGESRRFGSDKAAALVDGVPMLDRIAAALAGQVATVVVCGGPRPGYVHVPDRPAPGLGPLGGLAGALHHARAGGYDAVLTVACDVPDLPPDLMARLSPASCYVEDCPVIGLWDAALADRLDTFLREGADRSLRAWARACGARSAGALALANINRPGDLARYLSG